MDREYYSLAQTDDYDNQVWSSAEYKQHCSPHMVIVEEDDDFYSFLDVDGE